MSSFASEWTFIGSRAAFDQGYISAREFLIYNFGPM